MLGIAGLIFAAMDGTNEQIVYNSVVTRNKIADFELIFKLYFSLRYFQKSDFHLCKGALTK